MRTPPRNRYTLATRAFMLYLALGAIWILVSDLILSESPGITVPKLTYVQTLKGLAFVLATGLALYFYLRYEEKRNGVRERQFLLFVENAQDVFFRFQLKPTRKFDYVSPAAETLFGYDRREYYDDPEFFIRIVNSQDRDKIETMLSQQDGWGSEQIRWVCKNGNMVWASVNGHVVTDESGTAEAFEGIIRDITEQKVIEGDLRRTINQLTAVFEASPLPTYALDMEGRVLLWNPQAEMTFGYSEKEVIGNLLPTVPEHDIDRFKYLRERLIIHREIIRGVELKRRRKDGSEIQIRLSASPWVDETGNVVGSMNIAEDITLQKHEAEEKAQLQEQLYHAQRLETVGRLAGGVAHDINNALSVIMMSTDYIKSNLGPDHEIHPDLDEILEASERATNISRQLLAFSRKQKVQPVRVDLSEAVQGLLKMLRRLTGTSVDLNFDLAPDLPPVLIDPTQLEQVIVNLVVNARDAIEETGEIRIVTRRQRDNGRDRVLLVVSDTGHGMDRELLSNIFDPFFTTKPKELGTGLGLSTVYGIVQQNDGRIDVDSKVGDGTTFTISFPPLAEGDTIQHQERQREESLRGTETILLVEDENLLRTSLSRTFQMFGYRVESAETADIAYALLERGEVKPDLILIDVVMPGLSGPEMINVLPEKLLENVAVLFMSGYFTDKMAEYDNVDLKRNFIQKPFSQRDLLERVRSLLNDEVSS